MKAYQTDSETIVQILAVATGQGLSQAEVQKRQKEHGYNTLKTVKQRTIFSIFISQF